MSAWIEFMKQHGGGAVASSEVWRQMSEEEKEEYKPRRRRSRGGTLKRGRSSSRKTQHRSRSSSRDRIDSSVAGDGEVHTSVFNTRWEDLAATLKFNHWPPEIVDKMTQVYRNDIQAQGFRTKNKEWKMVVLPFAARDPTIPADWNEIMDEVRKVDVNLPGLETRHAQWLEKFKKTKTNSMELDKEQNAREMIFTIYMLQFVQLMVKNMEASKAAAIGKKVKSFATGVANGTSLVTKGIGMGVVGVLSITGKLIGAVLSSPFHLAAFMFMR